MFVDRLDKAILVFLIRIRVTKVVFRYTAYLSTLTKGTMRTHVLSIISEVGRQHAQTMSV